METQRIAIDPVQRISEGYLIPITRPGTTIFPVGDFFTIGRDPSSNLVLNDAFVSARHLRIEKRNDSFVLRDLHSRNGTYLNDSRVTEAVLSANDRIRVGETVYLFSEARSSAPDLVSKNENWNAQLKRLPAFATTDFPMLITGPSGSGKEIIARSIHAQSARSANPFICINCSALTENLIESELFGHTKGSFTGAISDRRGAFEAARGGTLFLDEIGDLPLTLQPKLLRALENNEIRPVGSDRTIETDVRIVAATHKNMAVAIRSGKFREDLYYRLNVCHIKPPALADRMEDFEDLLYQFAKSYRVRFSFAAIQKLKEHGWPGNIRELKNVIARASAYYPSHYIQPEDIGAIMETTPTGPEVHFVSEPETGTQGSIIKEIEREMIIRRLAANKGNQRQTARDLGLPKSTLHDRIRAYAINVDQVAKGVTDLEGQGLRTIDLK